MVNTFTGDFGPALEQGMVGPHDLDTPRAHGELPSISGISIQRGIYHHQAPEPRRPCHDPLSKSLAESTPEKCFTATVSWSAS